LAVRAGNVAVDATVAKKLDDSIQFFVSATVTVIFVEVTLGVFDRKSGCLGVAIGYPAEPVVPVLRDGFFGHLCALAHMERLEVTTTGAYVFQAVS
jgi:hypothetical protein